MVNVCSCLLICGMRALQLSYLIQSEITLVIKAIKGGEYRHSAIQMAGKSDRRKECDCGRSVWCRAANVGLAPGRFPNSSVSVARQASKVWSILTPL